MKTHNHYFKTNIDFVHHNSAKSENISHSYKLLNSVILSYYAHAVAKSTAEPENSNDLDKANSSTPLNRAFFVRSTRTPKENNLSTFGQIAFLSMVACNGKGSPFAVHLVEQFLSPLHVTAQTLRSLAVTPQLLDKDTVMKRFKFLTGSRLIITIYANNRQEAENKIKWINKPICIGLNLPSIQGVQYA
ncbi:TPA: ash family protein [Mannheimia haemolytica]|nr:ash family protein [Mannheimia haemolytica]